MESKKSEDVKKAEADASKMLKGAEQKGRQIIEEARKKADIETSKALGEVEQKGRLIIEEAKKKAEAEASKTLKEAEQKGRLIIEEAKKKAEAEASKTLKEAEQKGRLIIEEAKKKANAEAVKTLKEVEQKGRQIIEEAGKKAGVQAKISKPAQDTDQKTRNIVEEAREKAEIEASKIIAQAEQKGRQIIEESRNKVYTETKTDKPAPDPESRASKIIAEAEQKARQIIEEAVRIAAAPAAQRPQQIIKAVKEKTTFEAKGKADQQGAAYKKRVEIVIIPPVDFTQLEKLRTSLQRFPNLRVLAIGGSPGGGTQISISMDKPAPIAESLREMDVVEEAIEEELLDSHPLGDFVKQATPGYPTRRTSDEQRILVVLKRA
jgi:vacuolar-type H+-ATPase subunit H